jgi:serine/threonine-protein kinase
MLGRGRLGSVIYKATHRALDTTVAIRILKRDEHPNWDVVRGRFLVEARTLQVAHPGLLQVRDFGEDDKNVYLVTDFIEGPSLRQALAQSGPFPWTRAIALLTQAIQAVSVLHQGGGFISGVNPDMVRLRTSADGDAIIMSAAGIRSVQDVLATMREQELRGQEASEQELPYVAPEILMGGPPTIRSDVFTIGALAYQMVTAKPPFTAPSLPELMGKMLMTKPAAPHTINASVPIQASEAIVRALAGDQAQRFESVDALAAALRGDA